MENDQINHHNTTFVRPQTSRFKSFFRLGTSKNKDDEEMNALNEDAISVHTKTSGFKTYFHSKGNWVKNLFQKGDTQEFPPVVVV